MRNRIRTHLRQLRERAELRRSLHKQPPTTRVALWAAVDRYLNQRAANRVALPAQFPPTIRWP